MDLTELRRTMRGRRAALDEGERSAAAQAVARHLHDLHPLHTATRVGSYRAARGELDPAPIEALVRAHGARLYLPVMKPGAELSFVSWGERTTLAANRYGIDEPVGGRSVDPRRLDVVLVPLVAFDRTGHRVGLGAGYYDRAFAFKVGAPATRLRPLLVGLAYGFQEVAGLEAQPWDVRLDVIVTPETLLVPDPS